MNLIFLKLNYDQNPKNLWLQVLEFFFIGNIPWSLLIAASLCPMKKENVPQNTLPVLGIFFSI